MKKMFYFIFIFAGLLLFGANVGFVSAHPYGTAYDQSSSSINRFQIEQECFNDTLRKCAKSDSSYIELLHFKNIQMHTFEARKDSIDKIHQQKVDSLLSEKEYLLKEYPISIQYPPFAGIIFFVVVMPLLWGIYTFWPREIKHWNEIERWRAIPLLLFIIIVIFIVILGVHYYNKRELFWKAKEKVEIAQNEWQQKASNVHLQDSQLIELNKKLENTEQIIRTYEDSVKQQIQPVVECIYERRIFVRDSTQKAEARKLAEFIRKHNVHKKLKIIVCSWEKEPDTPEHGTLDGDFETSSSSVGIGGAFLGVGGGLGLSGGSSEGKGKLHGEYTGRVYGNDYHFFHFVLQDNSYHVIDASKNKMWRMARLHLIVQYDKVYTSYHTYTEKLTPLYNESFY